MQKGAYEKFPIGLYRGSATSYHFIPTFTERVQKKIMSRLKHVQKKICEAHLLRTFHHQEGSTMSSQVLVLPRNRHIMTYNAKKMLIINKEIIISSI